MCIEEFCWIRALLFVHLPVPPHRSTLPAPTPPTVHQVDAAVQRLRKLLRPSGINVDRFVEEFPVVLNVGDFELALEVGAGSADVLIALSHAP